MPAIRLITLALSCAIALPVQAQVILPGSCFLREYSADHLAKHPDQTVKMIALGPETGADEADAPILRVAVMVRGDPEIYVGAAYCDGWGKRMDCELEGDAGAFVLEPGKNGAARLTVARRGMSFEGSRDFVTLDGVRGDDRVFSIPKVPADACP